MEMIKKGSKKMADEEKKVSQEETKDKVNETLVDELDLDQKINDLLADNQNDDSYQLFQQKIEQQNARIAELNDQYLRQVADNRNMIARREEQEKKLRKYGARKLGELVVPDIDLFKKVLATSEKTASTEVQNYLKGFEMIVNKFDYSLDQVGIKELKIVVGSEFNPRTMEALEQVEATNVESGQVVEVISNPYMIYDEVLIHGKVKVAK